MELIDRALVVVRPGQLFLEWINEVEEKLDSPEKNKFTLVDIQIDPHSYLVPEQDEPAEIKVWLAANSLKLMEHEFASWCEDSSLWPSLKDPAMLDQWFYVEVFSMVFDLG
ncbi:MAG: hypothetical protein QNL04_03645 [SAR324 cluster bacterium]|nr:hypothetical protein [SAR324 cluster bacterium]